MSALVILSLGLNAQSIKSYEVNTKAAMKEINKKISDPLLLSKAMEVAKGIEASEMVLLSTKEYSEALESFGKKPNISNAELYAKWKEKHESFVNKYISVSDFVSRL